MRERKKWTKCEQGSYHITVVTAFLYFNNKQWDFRLNERPFDTCMYVLFMTDKGNWNWLVEWRSRIFGLQSPAYIVNCTEHLLRVSISRNSLYFSQPFLHLVFLFFFLICLDYWWMALNLLNLTESIIRRREDLPWITTLMVQFTTQKPAFQSTNWNRCFQLSYSIISQSKSNFTNVALEMTIPRTR